MMTDDPTDAPTRIKHLAWRWGYQGDRTAGLHELHAWASSRDQRELRSLLALSPRSAQDLAYEAQRYLQVPRRTRSGRWRVASRTYRTLALALPRCHER